MKSDSVSKSENTNTTVENNDNQGSSVLEDTMNRRVNGRLIAGLKSLKRSYDKDSVILTNEEGKSWTYCNDSNSFKDQLKLYFEILVDSPKDIFKSYINGYKGIIFDTVVLNSFDDERIYFYYKENFSIPRYVFKHKENLTPVITPGYDEYFENYVSMDTENIINKYYNKMELSLLPVVTAFTKVNLYNVLPFILLICFIAYVIMHKQNDSKYTKILELIIILYGTSFGFILSYVIMGAYIDRYAMPSFVPVYIADILVVMLLIKGGIELGKVICNRWKQHTK